MILGLLVLGACTAQADASVTPSFEPGERVCPIPERSAIAHDENGEGPAGATGGGALLLENARLIDGSGAKPREGVDILVEAGRIKEIGRDLSAPDGVVVIDVGGRTVLPGFIDTHTHLTFSNPPTYAEGVVKRMKSTEADRALDGAANARATLAAGFTTVRNVGGSRADSSLRDAIARGTVPGPRMFVANHSIGMTGGHCDGTNSFAPDVFGGPPDYETGVADGIAEVRKAVRYQIKHGADLIKICATGGVLSQGDGVGAPQLTLEEMKAIVEEANRAERKVAAHAHGNLGIREAVEAGVHSIEHGSILDDRTIQMMKRKGTYLVPTLMAADSVERSARAGKLSEDSAQKALDIAPKMRNSFKLAHEAGVKIALGSDAGVFPHGQNGHEFTLMVEMGMGPMDAIVAGTSAAADLIGVSDLGRIEPGFLADMVVVEGDPLQDITVVEAPSLVVKGGVGYFGPTWTPAS